MSSKKPSGDKNELVVDIDAAEFLEEIDTLFGMLEAESNLRARLSDDLDNGLLDSASSSAKAKDASELMMMVISRAISGKSPRDISMELSRLLKEKADKPTVH